jgi:hypothetical protein
MEEHKAAPRNQQALSLILFIMPDQQNYRKAVAMKLPFQMNPNTNPKPPKTQHSTTLSLNITIRAQQSLGIVECSQCCNPHFDSSLGFRGLGALSPNPDPDVLLQPSNPA